MATPEPRDTLTADSPINLGVQVVWGVTSTIAPAGFVIPSTTGSAFRIVEEDYHFTRQSEPHYEPSTGAVSGETFYRKEETIRLRVYPSGTTQADAKAANQHIFAPGTTLLITDTGVDDLNLAGTWVIVDSGKQRRFADKVYCDVSLRRYGGYVGPAPT